jgi:hypothetical protein
MGSTGKTVQQRVLFGQEWNGQNAGYGIENMLFSALNPLVSATIKFERITQVDSFE